MRPEVEQELSHTLLIELLAYQFASPVRWIETQDVVLGEKTTERIVEVGPADTLGVMAKRTLASKYEAHDAALSVQRQILCYNKDAKDMNLCQVEPVWADLNGGFQYIPNLKDLMTDLRKEYMETSEVRKAVIHR